MGPVYALDVQRHQSTVAVLLVALGLVAFVAMPFAFGLSSAREGARTGAERPGASVEKDESKDRSACDRKRADGESKQEAKERRKACKAERNAERRQERSEKHGMPPGWSHSKNMPPGWARRAEAWSRMHPDMARLLEACRSDPRPMRCMRETLRQAAPSPNELGVPPSPDPSLLVPTPPVGPSPAVPSPAPS